MEEKIPDKKISSQKGQRMDGSEMSRVGVRVTRRQRHGGGSHHHHHHHLNRDLPRLSVHCSFWEILGHMIMVLII